jgi:hypothetical protein
MSDTEYSVRTALSILENGSLLINAPDQSVISKLPLVNDTKKIYSPYGIGLSFIFLPIVLVGKVISFLGNFEQRLIINFLISFYNIPFALLGLYFFKKITIHFGSSVSKANMLMCILAIGTCYWKYTVTDFSEITQACCILGIVLSTFSDKSNKWVNISIWYSILFTIKLTYFIYLPLLLLYFISEHHKSKYLSFKKNFLCSSACVVPFCVLIGSLNYFRYGNIFESGYGSIIKFSFEFFKRDWFEYLISTERGILSFNPVLFISLLGLIFTPHAMRAKVYIICIVVLVWYITMCFWVSWQGGYCWGNRLLIPILPLLLIPLVFVPLNHFLTKAGCATVLLFSVFLQFSASFTKIHEIIEIKIRIQEVTDQLPSNQLYRGMDLFLHKLKTSKIEYLSSDFGVKSSEIINLTNYDTFHGVNLWGIHLLNHVGLKPYSYWAGIIILSITIILCIALFINNTKVVIKEIKH